MDINSLSTDSVQPNLTPSPHNHIDLFGFLTLLGINKWRIIAFCSSITTLTVIGVLFLDNQYTASTTVLIYQPNYLPKLDDLFKNPIIFDKIIQQHKLQGRYKLDNLTDTRKELGNNFSIGYGRAGNANASLVTISFVDKEPAITAEILNQSFGLLQDVVHHLYVARTERRYTLISEQINEAKKRHRQSITDYLAIQKNQGGNGELDKVYRSNIDAITRLRTEIAVTEIPMTIPGTDSVSNPTLQQKVFELQSLRSRLQKLEEIDNNSPPVLSENTRAIITAYREMKFQESVVISLEAQLEIARAGGSEQAPFLVQVNKATPPDKKSAPSHATIVLTIALTSLVLAILMTMLFYVKRLSYPQYAERYKALVNAWTTR